MKAANQRALHIEWFQLYDVKTSALPQSWGQGRMCKQSTEALYSL